MQVIKYKWHDWRPWLIAREGNEIKKIDLVGHDISFTLGERMCIGFFRGGNHFPCRNQRQADRQCNECRLEDDYFFCIRCDGSSCLNERKRQECLASHYNIYLAAFDSMLKVGISHEHRLMERLVEQGADFGAKIARMQDGKLVRAIEQRIKKEINIEDRLTGEQKNEVLFGNPNVAVGNITRAVSVLRSNGFSKYMTGLEIFDLRSYYHLHNVFSQPKIMEIKEGAEIKGRVAAAKGNLIIFQNNENFFSVNAHRLIGRMIETSN